MTVKEIKDYGKTGDVGALMMAYRKARERFRLAHSCSASISASRLVDASRRELERRGYHSWIADQQSK